MVFITRFSHLRFGKQDNELVITSERDDSFEVRHDWPDDLHVSDDSLTEELHKRFYTDALTKYDEVQE